MGGSFMALLLSSCSPAYFLYQAGKGQLRILNRAKPLEQVISDPGTSKELGALLSRIPEIRRFGEKSGLKPTPNYREYVSLDQDSVVYVVTIAESLEMKPKIFSFPVVGSFNDLGWFRREDAIEFAGRYEREGYDVDVRGASAYSTLGWFKDPLLSSMIPMQAGKPSTTAFAGLVNVLLHESVHATVYIPHQSAFNESLAVFVSDLLTRRFFESLPDPDRSGYQAWLEGHARWEKTRARLASVYRELDELYRSPAGDEEKKKRKEGILSPIREELSLKRPVNNAMLIQFKTYDPSDRGFSSLLERMGGDIGLFLRAVSRLREKDFPRPQAEEWGEVLSMLSNPDQGVRTERL
jgi:predicted aminopeptidase